MLFLVLIFAVPRQVELRRGLEHPDSAFEDRVGLVSKDYARATAGMLLREPRYQMVVYVDSNLPPDPLPVWSIAQAAAWKVGEQQDNGIALFIFRDARIARAVVGYALEGRLPDALVRRLLEDRLAPRFAAGDFEGGFDALIKGIDGALGGDEALGKLWLELGGKPRQSTADMLLALYTEGAERAPRLAVSAWRAYLEGDVAERVFVLLCAIFLLALLSATVAVTWVTITIFAKVRKHKTDAPGPALESRAASPPAPNLAVGLVGAFFSSLAIALLTLILAFALSLAEDLMHRKGDFSGAGAEVVWPAAR
ncbi:MAG: TPM domain-containing protein [Betaproteobacteria bacterium]|nr:TPM domain-containing protein [Betaproteobacteria bacterium]